MKVVNWDERYSGEEYVFGTEPNDFLVSVADKIRKGGKVLSLCEGEGRNGCFLARKGFKITAVDGSKVGLEKAKKLAAAGNVKIKFIVSDLENYEIKPDSWDAIVLIFAHFPPDLRKKVHAAIVRGLKKGGIYILEAFSPGQLQYDTGGPKDIEKLYDLNTVKKELEGLNFEIACEVTRDVYEGERHSGKSAVVRILARKTSNRVKRAADPGEKIKKSEAG